MKAQDYQITFPYGATSAPYSATSPHRGDDRACPQGTPIVIGTETIGFTGNTGKSTGPHLHIQEWNGKYSNTRKPQNAFKLGVVTNVDPTGTQGDGSFGKFITIQNADGWNDTYCHLSEISVHVGQVIGDNNMTKAEAYTVVDGFYRWGTGAPPTPEQSENWATEMSTNPAKVQELYDYMKKQAESQAPSGATVLKPGNYQVQ